MQIVNCLCYLVFGFVLARPSQNKLIWFSDAVLFVVEWRQYEECTEANKGVKLKKTDKKNYINSLAEEAEVAYHET